MKFELKPAINRLEDAIITMSGPALAISGIIAGVDLVTGGNMLKQFSWLALVWAICLLLTLDFQVLALGARAHKVYLSKSKETGRKVFEIVLAVCVAAAISYVSIQMQSIIARSNSAGLDIATATAQLGINPLALIWERSALVLVLIFLSGWFREGEEQEQPTPAQVTQDMDILIERLDAVYTQRLEAIVERTVERVTISIIEEQRTPAIAEMSTLNSDVDTTEQQIRTLLEEDNTLSARAIAIRVGCSPTTASKWKNRIEQSA